MTGYLHPTILEQLRMDLATQGYTGSTAELDAWLERAYEANQERMFWAMLGRTETDTATEHPLTKWIAERAQHFHDVTFYPKPDDNFAAIQFSGRKNTGGELLPPEVVGIKVQVTAKGPDNRWACRADHYVINGTDIREEFDVSGFETLRADSLGEPVGGSGT